MPNPNVGGVNPVPGGLIGAPRIGGVVGLSKDLDRGLGPFGFATGDLVAFQSNRALGNNGNDVCGECDPRHNLGNEDEADNYDIFVYDALAQTVLALPGVNTDANESNPRLSSNGRFMVYQTDENGSDDIHVYDMGAQLIDTLNTLNTPNFNEREPDVSDDGNLIVYVSDDNLSDFIRHERSPEDLRRGKDGKVDGKGGDGKRVDGGRERGEQLDNSRGVDGKGCDNCGEADPEQFTETVGTADYEFDAEPGGDQAHRQDELRIYNTHNGANYKVPIANAELSAVTWPSISGDGQVIAYGASDGFFDFDNHESIRHRGGRGGKSLSKDDPHEFSHHHRGDGHNSEVFIYSLGTAAQLTPPFINDSDGDQYNPDLDATGSAIAYVSNRHGSEDIFVTDMRSGFSDNLVFANTDCREQEPRFLGLSSTRIIFQSDRGGEFAIYAYDMPTSLLDTLPILNEEGADTQLRDSNPNIRSNANDREHNKTIRPDIVDP